MTPRSRAFRQLAWLTPTIVAVSQIVAIGAASFAQSPGGKETAPPSDSLLFRREQPPKALEAREAAGLIPVDRAEFERLLERIRARSNGAGGPGPRIESAAYVAQFDGRRLLGGRAELKIDKGRDDAASGLQTLAFDECALELRAAIWQADPPRQALLGADPRGRWVLAVEQSGVLTLDWSATPRATSSTECAFELRAPQAVATTWTIDAPEGWSLAATYAVVESRALEDDATGARRRWSIAPTGEGASIATFRREGATVEAEQNVFWHEETTYRVGPTETDLVGRWTFDALGGPLSEATFRVPAGTRVVAVHRDRAPLPFRAIPWSAEGEALVRITPTTPWQGAGQTLTIEAVTRTQLSASATLPVVVPANGSWQDGLRAVEFDESLAVGRFAVAQGLHTANAIGAPTPDGAAGGTRLVQCFSSATTIDYTASRRSPELRFSSVAVLRVAGEEWTGETWFDFATGTPGSQELRFAVSAPWTIDSIRVDPEDALDDWESRPSDSVAGETLAIVRCREGAVARSVAVTCRRQAPETAVWSRADLTACEMQDATAASAVAALIAPTTDATWLFIPRENATKLSTAEWPEVLRARLEDAQPAVAIGERFPADYAVARASSGARYTTAIATEVAIEGVASRQRTRIRVSPQGTAVDRVAIQWTAAGGSPWRWSIQPSDVELDVVAPLTEGVVGESPLWEVSLRSPSSSPFEIVAEAESPLVGADWREEIPLASCPGAATQTGVVNVMGVPGETPWRCETTALSPEATPEGRTGRRFRWRPPVTPRLIVAAVRETAAAPIVVDRASLRVWSTGDAYAEHTLTLDLRFLAARPLSLRLPPGGKWRSLAIDGRSVPFALSPDAPSEQSPVAVELPIGRSEARIEASFVAPDGLRPWRFGNVPAWPEWSAPTLSRDLQLHTADAAAALSVDASPWGRPWSASAVCSALLGPWANERVARGEGRNAHLSTPAARMEGVVEHVAGWRSQPVRAAVDAKAIAPSVVVVDRSWLRIGLATLGLLGLGLGRWVRPPFRGGTAAVVAAAGIATLMIDGCVAGCGWPLFVGALVGAMAAWSTSTGACAKASIARPRRSTSEGIVLSVMLTLMTLLAAALSGHDPVAWSQSPADKKPKIWRVVDPVEADGSPAGTRVFLAKEFYQALDERARSVERPAFDWLLVGARHQIRADIRETSDPAQAHEVTSLYEFETFVSPAELRLRLPRAEWPLTPGATRLNGTPIVPTWDADGQWLTVKAPEKGLARLELTARPTLKVVGEFAGFSVSSPDCPATEVVVKAAARDLPRVRLGGRSADRFGRIEGLSATFAAPRRSRLDVQWPVATSGAAKIEVEQLALLDARPGSVRVQTQWRARGPAGGMREFRVQYDPRLAWLPKAAGAADEATPELELATRTLVWRFPTAMTEAVVSARWLMRDVAGAGAIPAPSFVTSADRVTRNWIGVRVGPGQEVSPPRDLVPVSSEAFSQAWKVDRPSFDAAFDLSAAPSTIQFVGRLRSSTPVVAQRTLVEHGRLGTLVRWEAEVGGLGLGVFQHELSVPRGMIVRSVRVGEGAFERPGRYAAIEPGVGVIQLNSPAASSQRLALEGWLPPTFGVRSPLAKIGLRAVAPIADRVEVVRARDVRVALDSIVGYRPVDVDTFDRALDDQGRRTVAVYETDLDGAPWDQRVVFSRVDSIPDAVIERPRWIVDADAPTWSAKLEGSAPPDGPQVDSLVVHASTDWSGPWETAPPARVRVEGASSDGRARLRIVFERPLKPGAPFSVSGPIAATAGDTFSAATVELDGVAPGALEVVLPRLRQKRPLAWDFTGLQTVGGDEDGAPALVTRVVSDDWSARVAPTKDEQTAPREPQRFVSLAIAAPNQWMGTAAWIVYPQGVAECRLRAPAECAFISVHVQGSPAIVERSSDEVVVPLLSDRLPQIVVARFASPRVPGARSIALPTMADRGYEWVAFVDHETSAPSDGAVAEPARTWLAAILDAFDSGDEDASSTGASSEAIRAWSDRLAREAAATPSLDSAAREVRAKLLNPGRAALFVADNTDADLAWWRHVSAESGRPIKWVQTDSHGQVEEPGVSAPFAASGGWIAALTLAGCLIVATANRAVVRTFQRWPHATLALAGVVAAACVDPTWIGWGIVAVAVVGSLRATWPAGAVDGNAFGEA